MAKRRRTEENRALALHSNSGKDERQSTMSSSLVSDEVRVFQSSVSKVD